MVARDPNRPKASDLSEADVLTAVESYAAGGPFVTDQFPSIPGKVVVEKLRKLQGRGLVQAFDDRGVKRYCLTSKGREALNS